MAAKTISKREQPQYSVTITGKETVVAGLPLQEHRLALSNLDLLLPPVHFGVFFCYEKPAVLGFPAVIAALKASLARTLVSYYPLAGEIIANADGEAELLCNNSGVLLVEAFADVELRELCLHNPDDSVEGKLIPTKMEGALSVQVTELRGNEIVVACMFDHRISDAYSANMFLVSWAEAAVGRPMSVVPSFRRSLLSPCQTKNHESFNRLYAQLSSLPPPVEEIPAEDRAISRIYLIATHHVEQMQAAASTGARRSSKLEAFSAYLWQIIGKAAADGCRLGIVVDGRARLGVAMGNYYGNVLSIPYSTLRVDELKIMDVSEVAEAVHDFLAAAATAEHFRGLVEWVEAVRPEKALARIYCDEGGGKTPSLVVSSGQRFPVAKLDFGWGTPAFGSYHFPWGSSAGYIMPMPTARGVDGDWVVYVHMAAKLVTALESEAGDIFRCLSPEHLNLAAAGDAMSETSPRVCNAVSVLI